MFLCRRLVCVLYMWRRRHLLDLMTWMDWQKLVSNEQLNKQNSWAESKCIKDIRSSAVTQHFWVLYCGLKCFGFFLFFYQLFPFTVVIFSLAGSPLAFIRLRLWSLSCISIPTSESGAAITLNWNSLIESDSWGLFSIVMERLQAQPLRCRNMPAKGFLFLNQPSNPRGIQQQAQLYCVPALC